jgi:hypothetical protein
MKRSYLLLLLSALAASPSVYAKEPLRILMPAKVYEAGIVPQAVAECGIANHLASTALAAIVKHGFEATPVATVEEAGNEKVVVLTIMMAQGFGGGGWSGAKSMVVKASLRQGGVSLASKEFRRTTHTLGGMFSGTCPMFQKVAESIGGDTAVWLKRGEAAKIVNPGATQADPAVDAPAEPAN